MALLTFQRKLGGFVALFTFQRIFLIKTNDGGHLFLILPWVFQNFSMLRCSGSFQVCTGVVDFRWAFGYISLCFLMCLPVPCVKKNGLFVRGCTGSRHQILDQESLGTIAVLLKQRVPEQRGLVHPRGLVVIIDQERLRGVVFGKV